MDALQADGMDVIPLWHKLERLMLLHGHEPASRLQDVEVQFKCWGSQPHLQACGPVDGTAASAEKCRHAVLSSPGRIVNHMKRSSLCQACRLLTACALPKLAHALTICHAQVASCNVILTPAA